MKYGSHESAVRLKRIIKPLLWLALCVPAGLHLGQLYASEKKSSGIWGPDDTLGSANYLSSANALKAVGLVTEGKVYALGLPVSRETPAVSPRSLAINITMPDQYGGATLGANGASYLDDMITGWNGIGTQIDSLAHAGQHGTFYNGNKAADFVTPTGVTKLGVENIPPIVTRGVLINVAAVRGVERLAAGDVITVADIQAALELSKLTINQGDVAVIHTGWLSMLDEDPQQFLAGEPGLNRAAAEFLVSKGVVAVGADNWGVEAVPFPTDAYFDVHVILLYENGTYILECLDTRELVADGVSEFMFVLGQPRYVGAVQAMVNPIAIR